jgi:hypothetical protein
MSEVITRPAFQTTDEAWQWVYEQDLEYADNHRFAFTDDPTAVAEYEEKQERG